MALLIVASGCFFIAVGFLIHASIASDLNQRLLAKCSASVMFLAICVFSYLYNQANLYFTYIFLALLCSFFGDLFLGAKHLQQKTYFILGLVAFLGAQVIYVLTFIALADVNVIAILASLLLSFVALVAPLHTVLNEVGKKEKLLLIAYFFIVTTMVFSAFHVANKQGISLFTAVLLLASVLFYCSDLLLLWKYFGKRSNKAVGLVSSGCYFAAQYLFAISVAFYVLV